MNDINIGIVGCGFVADYYMATRYAYPNLNFKSVFDLDKARLTTFCEFYGLDKADSLEEMLADASIDLILNLTNPREHYTVSKAALLADKHVYSEKPFAMNLEEAQELVDLSKQRSLVLSSAPCNALGRSAKTLRHALKSKICGDVKLVYAELEDGFVPVQPYKKWQSASGAPWPYRDEFEIGCTLEHAGYYLGWLVLAFGPVSSVTAVSGCAIEDKVPGEPALSPSDAADFSVGVLTFESGVTVRLSTSIVAEKDHQIRLFGDKGIIRVKDVWDNADAIVFQNYVNIRRKTILNPIKKKVHLPYDVPHYKMDKGKTKMDFLLGVEAVAHHLKSGKQLVLDADVSLHINEIAFALQYAGAEGHCYKTKTRFELDAPAP